MPAQLEHPPHTIERVRSAIFVLGFAACLTLQVSCRDGSEAAAENTKVAVLREGLAAPDLDFESLDGNSGSLADYRGRIVLLEFWASWCVNCKSTMEHLQRHREKHPDWRDRVEIITVSIDDSRSAAEEAIEKRGWTTTHNAWADPEDGNNAQLVTYVGKGIPAAYVIDSEGIVRRIGHPGKTDHAGVVDQLLTQAGTP